MKVACLVLILTGCATASAPSVQETAKVTETTPEKTLNEEGPATRKLQMRQAAMQQQLDYTLGEPLHSAVRKKIEAEKYSQTLKEMMERETQYVE